MTDANGKQIYTLLSRVMADIGAVGKDQFNSQQHYKFRGIDDVYNAVQPALVRHGIIPVPTVDDHQLREVRTSKGNPAAHVTLRLRVDLFAPDGSSVTASAFGEGLDVSDKATNKAMSGAYKYVLFQLFCIPTEESKDPERDHIERGSDTLVTNKRRVLGIVRDYLQRHSSGVNPRDFIKGAAQHLLGRPHIDTEAELSTVEIAIGNGAFDPATGDWIPTDAIDERTR